MTMDVICMLILVLFSAATWALVRICEIPEERKGGGKLMNWIYLLSGVIAFCLLVYLFVALLRPEKFE